MTAVLSQKVDRTILSRCVSSLESGGVIVFPTDTVYGIGCNAFDPHAVRKIYELKGRDYKKPLPLLLGSKDQLSLVAREVPKEAYALIEAFWPGPLTLVFKTSERAVHAARGKETIAVRVPDHGIVRQIVTITSIPLATTSANISGEKAAHTFLEVQKIFQGRADVLVDGGECQWREPSTVVDATHFPFTVLREGAIPKTKLLKAIEP